MPANIAPAASSTNGSSITGGDSCTWCITSGSLVALHAAIPHASPAEEILVLTPANLVATLLRFVLLRGWVFRARRAAPEEHLTPVQAAEAADRTRNMEIA